MPFLFCNLKGQKINTNRCEGSYPFWSLAGLQNCLLPQSNNKVNVANFLEPQILFFDYKFVELELGLSNHRETSRFPKQLLTDSPCAPLSSKIVGSQKTMQDAREITQAS